jgi:hypothetical protein
MQDGDYSVVVMIGFNFVLLCFPLTRHKPQATAAVGFSFVPVREAMRRDHLIKE